MTAGFVGEWGNVSVGQDGGQDCGSEPLFEICDNSLDDDGDGLTDCDDGDCADSSVCQEDPPTPSCALKKEACSTGDDCCSGRCNTSKGACL